MPYPLLVPREQAGKCLELEAELVPMVGVVCPDVHAMRGKGCKFWKDSEIFVTDDNDPAVIERLKAMGAEVMVLGPIDWDNLGLWRMEGMKRIPLNRWFRGAPEASDSSLYLAAALEGKDHKIVKKWLRNAQVSGILADRKSTFGTLYSFRPAYYPWNYQRKAHGTNEALHSGLQPGAGFRYRAPGKKLAGG